MHLLQNKRFLCLLAVVIVGGAITAWAFVRPLIGAAALFSDITVAAGFKHTHQIPQLDEKLKPVMRWVAGIGGAAAAAGDFDNDGWVDLYVTQSKKGVNNYLYRNVQGKFVDVAETAGVADLNDDSGVCMACIWGDYDNDGRLDLYIVKWGRNQLFHNNGDGTFTNVTDSAFRDEDGQPGSPWANGAAAVWVDYDRDAYLDIYVGNYFSPLDLSNLPHTRVFQDDFEKARNGGPNFLFHNNRDGTFTEVASSLGVDDTGWTLSVGHGDVNNDGWPDIYCANDFGTDQLFLNNGDGTFRNVTEDAMGLDAKKGMNVDFGDIDGDGWLDIYVTNITTRQLREGNMLWHNAAANSLGVPVFMDISTQSGTADGGWGWGAKFFDFDNDADLDIVSLNGYVTAGKGDYLAKVASWQRGRRSKDKEIADAAKWPDIGNQSFAGNEAKRLWRNEGRLRFVEVAEEVGIDNREDGRGVVVFDYDNDGDLDLYFANQGTRPVFYQNNLNGRANWLGFKLHGRPESGSNRDAVAARVTVVTPAGQQIRELDGGNSYCGQSDRRLFFGLDHEPRASVVEVRWPSGQVQVLKNVRANQVLELEEAADLPAVTSLIPTSR